MSAITEVTLSWPGGSVICDWTEPFVLDATTVSDWAGLKAALNNGTLDFTIDMADAQEGLNVGLEIIDVSLAGEDGGPAPAITGELGPQRTRFSRTRS